MKKPRIFIIPTRFGMVFMLGALVMILVGATYQNNLVNLLAFFMLSLVFVSMVQTHNNLKDIQLTAVEVENGYAGQFFLVTFILKNTTPVSRFNLEANLRGKAAISVYENVLPLLPLSTLKLRSSYQAGPRGPYVVRDVKISSTYPIGLFRAWFRQPIQTRYLVYPAPRGDRPYPTGGAGDASRSLSHKRDGDDFHGHRKYQPGDSHRHIDWKAYARGRPLMVKEFHEGAPQSSLFDWDSLSGLGTEERLSQISAWIEEAKSRKGGFGLRLPGLSIPVGKGHQHMERCLEALALYDPTKKGEVPE